MKILSGLFSSALLVLTSQAHAFPELNASFNENAVHTFAENDDYDFEGIVALSNCSGSVVRFDDSLPEDKAMILTNGHCVGMINPGVVRYKESSRKSFTVLSPSSKKLGRVYASQLAFGTMTKTDMAIYLLRESYEDISNKYGVEALTFARDYVEPGTDIEVISGYWRRGYSCQAEEIVHQLREGDWFFQDSIRYSRPGCLVVGGTSGSPIIEAGTRTVIGVNNTGNESGRKCSVNNPCEISKDGEIKYEKGYSYGQQTSWIYSCRDIEGNIDLNVEGCLLPKP